MSARPDKPPRSRARRFTTRAVVVLLVLFVLAIVAAQIVLWTNVPRDIATGAIQKALGLRVTAAGLSTGFFGHTTLRDVSLALPLSDESFLHVPTLRVSHTTALGLIFKRTVAVDSIELDAPTVTARQDAAGRWNLQDVADQLARLGGGGDSRPTGGSGPATVALPRVRLTDGVVRVIAKSGAEAELSPVNLNGDPEGTLTWKFDAAVGERLKATGRVAAGGDFTHEVDLQLHDPKPWVALLTPGFDNDVRLNAQWHGALRAGGLAGRLDVREAKFDNVTASGPVAIAANDVATKSLVTVDARGLVVRTGQKALPEIAIVGGGVRVASSGGAVTVDRLRLALAAGNASLSARFEPSAGTLTAGAVWQDLTVAGANVRNGSFDVNITQPLPDRPRVVAKLVTVGDAYGEKLKWDAAFDVTGEGRGKRADGTGGGLADIDWTVFASRLALASGIRKTDLSGTTARASTAGSLVTLDSLSRSDADALAGGGQFDGGTGDWHAHVDGGGVDAVTAFSASAWRRGETLSLDHFYVRRRNFELTARGYYLTSRPEPVFVNVSLTQLRDPAELVQLGRPPLVRGRVLGDFYVHGEIEPTDVYAEGWLTGENVVVGDRELGDLKLTADATLKPGMTWHFATHELSLFDGKWAVEAGAPTPWDATRVTLRVTDLPLASVASAVEKHPMPVAESPATQPTTALATTMLSTTMLSTSPATAPATTRPAEPAPSLAGLFNGQWTADLTDFGQSGVVAVGAFDVVSLRAGPLEARTLTGRTRLDNGRLRNEVVLKQGEGVAALSVETALTDLTTVDVTADVKRWPFMPTPRTLTITDLAGSFDVDLQKIAATGKAEAKSTITRDDKPLGSAGFVLAAEKRIFRLTDLAATLAGGSAIGSAVVDLDDLTRAAASFKVTRVAAGDLTDVYPAAVGLAGTFDATFDLAPDVSPRALAPLAAVFTVTPADGAKYLALDLGRLDARAAIDPDTTWRVVLDKFDLNVAGGLVSLWGRVTRQATDDPILVAAGRGESTVTQGTVRWRDVELDQVVQSAKPGEKTLNAKLSGRVNALTSTLTDNVVGDGTVVVSQGRLVNFEPVRKLFEQLGVAPADPNEPGKGQGRVRVRYEGSLLRVSDFEYVENGIDMRAFATVSDIDKGKDAAITGQLVGSLRPFKDLKIPFLATADEILSLLQSSVTPIRIFNTVGDVKAEPGFLGDAKGALRELFTGDAGGSGSE